MFGQSFTQRGFVEGATFVFPQQAPNDPTRVVLDVLAREEAFGKPARWIQFAAGVDVRANTHDQVGSSWRPDFGDRGQVRPRLSIRRLTTTLTRGGFTVDVGKQFIRWGKADIVTPTDRFAPRDFLNVVDNELLAVTGARVSLQVRRETVEAVWVPRFTPSRIPLFDQRWSAVPAEAARLPIVVTPVELPRRAQTGVRWGHGGSGFEYSLCFYDGFNHLPNIDAAVQPLPPAIVLARTYPELRGYGGDAALPTQRITIKGEAMYFTSSSPSTDEYVLYVLQVERQSGEWLFVGGYAGEVVTKARAALTFAPDRGMARAVVGRASYTIDPTRSFTVEGAARQSGGGVYVKGEYSQARGPHWRATIAAVAIAGRSTDFLGQYRRNSHAALSLRYSF